MKTYIQINNDEGGWMFLVIPTIGIMKDEDGLSVCIAWGFWELSILFEKGGEE